MKKILCIAVICFGFTSLSQAQVLKYIVGNGSSNKVWNWAMADAGPTPAQYELDIQPGEVRYGGVGFFSFNLEWKAEDSNSCYVNLIETGPIPATTVPTTCGFSATVTYKVVEVIPLVYYIYKAELN